MLIATVPADVSTVMGGGVPHWELVRPVPAEMGARYKFLEGRAALDLIRRVMRWRPIPIIPLASFLVTYATTRDHDSCLGGLYRASPSPECGRNARKATIGVILLRSSNILGFLC